MNDFPWHIIRGYDIRGIAETELADENVRVLAKAYVTFLYRRQIKSVVVGHDCRISSPRIHKVFIEELTNGGVNVIDIGLTLTQIFYFAQYHYLCKGGAIITASHNPKEYNGMKMAVGYSDTMTGVELDEMREIIKTADFKKYGSVGKLTQDDVYPAYEKYLLSLFEIENKFKIVIDACNGTTGMFLPRLLRTAGFEIVEQNCELDGNFPLGTPDPTEKIVLSRLAERVIMEKADIGFAYDADGDRLGIVDNEGRFVWNDNLVSIFAKDVLNNYPGTKILFNTLCSRQVVDVITSCGGIPYIWKTGHSFIKAKLKEERMLFGGELSGHFFFMDNFFGHDDAAYASLRLLTYLENNNQTLKEALDILPKYYSSPQVNLGCADDVKFLLISEKISTDLRTVFPEGKFTNIDGIRVDTDESMVIIRASQNGPYIALKIESKTQEGYDQLKQQIKNILQKYPEVDFSKGVNTDALD